MPNGQIVTFYSYKGGVGRSFLLSNVATLLAQWGYKVLCIDWDLEAPGLHYYFQPYMGVPQSGLVDMVLSVSAQRPVGALDHVTQVTLPGSVSMDLITAGGRNPSYVTDVQSIDWDHLYSDADFGNILEEWRQIWINSYDIILVDSRTGISDSGGICTSQLPHVLAYAFTANQQNLDGVLDVVTRAAKARNRLPYDRSRLLTLPLLCRFDMSEEYERATEWREKLSTELKSSYNAWVPESSDTDRVIDNCTVPYSAYWSFGEELPVLSEDTRNPRLISYSIASIAALIARKMKDVTLFTESRDAYVDNAIRAGRRGGEYRHEVFVSSAPNMMREARNLSRLLTAEGVSTFFPGEEGTPGHSNAWSKRMHSAIDTSQHFVFLIRDDMKTPQRDELNYFLRQTLDEQSDRKVFPVVASREAQLSLPSIIKGVTTYSLSDNSLASIARMIKLEISGDGPFSNSAAHHQLGIAAQNRGDLAAAERHFRNALAIDERLNDRFGVATSHRQLGRIAQLRGEYRQAEDHTRVALTVFEELGDRANIATSYRLLGLMAQIQGEYRQAEDHTRVALTIFEELGDRANIASSHHLLGLMAQARGDNQQAEEQYRASLTIEGDLGDRPGMADTYHQLGMVTQKQERLEEAEDWYRQSLTINQDLGNRPDMARTYHQLGMVAQQQERLEEAEDWYRQSLTINQDLGNRPDMARTYHQLGMVAQQQERLEEAEDWYRQSLTINQDLGNRPDMARTYHQLGMVAQQQERLEEAEDWYRQSLTIKEELGNRPDMARTYHQLGMVAQEQERLEEAEDWYRQSLTIKEELGDRPGMARTYHQLGMVAQEQERLEEAEDWYRQSLTIEEELGDRSGMARTYHQLGMVAQEQERLEEAEDWYRQSLTIEEELGNRSGILDSYGQLGVLRTEQQRPADGVPYTLRALAIAQEIGRPSGTSLFWLGRQRTFLGDAAFRSILDDLLSVEEALSIMNATQPQDESASDNESTSPSNPTNTDQV